MTPETNMFQALILQAFRDAVMLRDSTDYNSTAIWLVKSEAVKFLTDEEGDWADSRALVCQAADFDPDYVRERAVLFLAKNQGVQQREVSRYRVRLRTRVSEMASDA